MLKKQSLLDPCLLVLLSNFGNKAVTLPLLYWVKQNDSFLVQASLTFLKANRITKLAELFC